MVKWPVQAKAFPKKEAEQRAAEMAYDSLNKHLL